MYKTLLEHETKHTFTISEQKGHNSVKKEVNAGHIFILNM